MKNYANKIIVSACFASFSLLTWSSTNLEALQNDQINYEVQRMRFKSERLSKAAAIYHCPVSYLHGSNIWFIFESPCMNRRHEICLDLTYGKPNGGESPCKTRSGNLCVYKSYEKPSVDGMPDQNDLINPKISHLKVSWNGVEVDQDRWSFPYSSAASTHAQLNIRTNIIYVQYENGPVTSYQCNKLK